MQALFKQVSKETFFEALEADPRDIMPNLDDPNRTVWQTQHDRVVFGITTPGWKNPGAAKTYSLLIK